MSHRFLFRSAAAPEVARLREWHRILKEQKSRGDRARLRRTKSIDEAALAPAFHDLVGRLALTEAERSPDNLSRLAALAMLAAWVETDEGDRRLGLSLGIPPGKKEASVSDARFRRLLESEELQGRFEVLRRLVVLVDRKASLTELAGALFDWNANRRRQLAYDYYSGFAGSSEIAESSAITESNAIAESKVEKAS